MHSVEAPRLHYNSASEFGFAEYVLQRISLYAQRRIIWLRYIWQAVAANSEGPTQRHMEVDGYLWQTDNADDEFNFYRQDTNCVSLTNRIDTLEASGLKNVSFKRYRQVVQTMRLNPYEEDLLQLCFAAALDNDLKKVLAYLHNDSSNSFVSSKLVAQLFGHNTNTSLLPDSPLIYWNCIYQDAFSKLEIDAWFQHWLNDFEGTGELLSQYANFQTPVSPHASWPLQSTVATIVRLVEEKATPIRLLITGTINSGRKSFAACVCEQLGQRLLMVDASLIPASQQRICYLQTQRLALLTSTVIAWQGIDFNERFQTFNLPASRLQIFIGETGERLQPQVPFIDISAELPVLNAEQRLQAWQEYVPSLSAWNEDDKSSLIRNHQAALGTIIQAGKLGCSTKPEALQILRSAQLSQLGDLAHAADAYFNFDDLIISDAVRRSLNDFCFEANERLSFWENEHVRKLFPQGRSLIGLFSGVSGTGKTMAAQVIANKLGLALYRVDLSTVISKYIGESAKNLKRILNRASQMNIVLLFDEADALFGKRTETKDAHDRYANSDTNYLLQAIEEYSGIVILSTNRKSNIDPAFLRRFRYVVEFSRPEPIQRKAIWQAVISGLRGEKEAQDLEPVLDKISKAFDLTGAQIKLAVLSAVFISKQEAQALQAKHLMLGIEREVAKEGKALQRDLQNLF